MSVVNLLPRHRRAKLRTQRHLRLWAGSLGVYTAILSAAVAGAAIFAPPHATSIEQALVRTDRLIAQREAELDRRQSAARAIATDLRLVEAVGKQPDWSILLRLVAAELGEETALSAWSVEPIAGTASATQSSGTTGTPRAGSVPQVLQEPAGYSMRVVGMAPSHAVVTDAVLRLEDTGLFRSVRLESARQDVRGSTRFASFTIVAELNPQAQTANHHGEGRQ